ncbi:VanZ family protein [Paenibacillus riograndensis]|uniref:VanZ family protein n=1 Tax=Paenibacillus riograndensis SBR5 TaxID=1073571 RepID=A0A0E4HC95_9BACL|nr:VanZ family protein [Paenibacillus riograndensis]CQR56581.1 VanZ family protein [Paenibacillus riograndensis SBR5]
MNNKESAKEKVLWYCVFGLFTLYFLFLLRITLFKQASFYNLFAAIGASERTVSIVPFKSIFEMISSSVSITRILENVVGNIAIFIPMGLLLPIIIKRRSRNVILGGILFSAFIEIIQFIFGLGSTDIDDLIFNTLGTITGYLLFTAMKRKSKSNLSFLTSLTTLLIVSGSIAFGILFVNHTALFVTSPKETTVENGELVQGFIETPFYFSGKFVEAENSILTVEKSIQSASEQRELMKFEVTAESRLYVCYDKIDYFFSTVSGEHQRYEQITYTDFASQKSEVFRKENNVIIWSSDGKKVDNLVVIEWIQ